MKALAAVLLACGCWAAPQGDPLAVDTQHPRLFLTPARLRLLKRERERNSARWRGLDGVANGAFARALQYQVSGDAAVGRQAVASALAGSDLREMALVFDWCRDLPTDAQRSELAGRIAKAMAAEAPNESVPAVSARTLAALAIYGEYPDAPEVELNWVVHTWWEGRMAPALKAGKDVIPRDDALPLFELLHAVRDATGIDLRKDCPHYFLNLPAERLMSYYPAAYKGPSNSFRAGAERTAGAPEPQRAARSRAADLAMVALDPDAPESQALQGWLMHDPFAMRDAPGAPYEFLWANPYQPGLSYYHLPLAYYDEVFGKLFVRSSWDDSATWLGCWDGAVQKFANGRAAALTPEAAVPERFDAAVVMFGAHGFRIKLDHAQRLFVAALEPRRAYRVEIEGRKPFDAAADPGGILELHPPEGKDVKVTIR
jgi:hypothetical protein